MNDDVERQYTLRAYSVYISSHNSLYYSLVYSFFYSFTNCNKKIIGFYFLLTENKKKHFMFSFRCWTTATRIIYAYDDVIVCINHNSLCMIINSTCKCAFVYSCWFDTYLDSADYLCFIIYLFIFSATFCLDSFNDFVVLIAIILIFLLLLAICYKSREDKHPLQGELLWMCLCQWWTLELWELFIVASLKCQVFKL